MKGAVKLLIALLVVAVMAFGAYSYLNATDPRWNSAEGGPFGSGHVKIDVTIGVVGISTFIVGFGMRDVIGRWYQSAKRKKAMAAHK